MVPRFRVWHLKEKRMYSVFDIRWLENGEVSYVYLLKHKYERMFPNEVIFMQSTGLMDSRGKEIFEGDIVKASDEVAEVKKSPDTGNFYLEPELFDWSWNRFACDNYLGLHGVEVIGNIREDSILLFKKDD